LASADWEAATACRQLLLAKLAVLEGEEDTGAWLGCGQVGGNFPQQQGECSGAGERAAASYSSPALRSLVGLPRTCWVSPVRSLPLQVPFSPSRLPSFVFFPADSLSRHPEQRLLIWLPPRMIWRKSEAKATISGHHDRKADAI